jgi:HAD superfamily hydrolase (TIGR01509 family)
VPEVLPSLAVGALGVVTNCSETLASRAVHRVGVPLEVVVSAERAGAYKPDPRPYGLALHELGLPPERVLFVAGSPSDIMGASEAGMTVFWHNRLGLESPWAKRAMRVGEDLWHLQEWLDGPT